MTAFWHAAAYGLAALLTCLFARRAGAAAALFLAAPLLAWLCGLGFAAASKSFSLGFGAAAAEPGIAVVCAALIGVLAVSCDAPAPLARLQRRMRAGGAAPLVGLLAGIGASPASALAIAIRPANWLGGRRAVFSLGGAANAAHGLLLPAPPIVAATVILGASWRTVLSIGLPLTFAIAGLTAMAASGLAVPRGGMAVARQGAQPPDSFSAAFTDAAEPVPPMPPATHGQAKAAAAGLCASVLAVLALLILRALGDLPSEPLGGGSAREALLGAGRPLTIGVAAVLILIVATARRGLRIAMGGGFEDAVRCAAPLVLGLGLAGGLQAIAAGSRMAESIADSIAANGGGLAAPFLMAATFRALQGAPLTAAIATAGIVQPALAPLGLDSPAGHALAALAAGAGSLSAVNVNDPMFWIATAGARLTARGALAWITLGTALQGLAALCALYAVQRVFAW